jgi:hypothetical protein
VTSLVSLAIATISLGFGGEAPVVPYCSGEKFDSVWVLWSESCLSLFDGVEGGLAGAQREGLYFRDWVELCLSLFASGLSPLLVAQKGV